MTLPYCIAGFYLGIAEAYLVAAEKEKGSERTAFMKKARHACYEALRFGKIFSSAMPEALRLQGNYLWLLGRHSEARQQWERSLAQAESLGMPYEAAMTRLVVGRRAGDVEHFNRGEAELRGLGVKLA